MILFPFDQLICKQINQCTSTNYGMQIVHSQGSVYLLLKRDFLFSCNRIPICFWLTEKVTIIFFMKGFNPNFFSRIRSVHQILKICQMFKILSSCSCSCIKIMRLQLCHPQRHIETEIKTPGELQSYWILQIIYIFVLPYRNANTSALCTAHHIMPIKWWRNMSRNNVSIFVYFTTYFDNFIHLFD